MDAQTAADWRREADVRAEVAEEIAADFDRLAALALCRDMQHDVHGHRKAAAIVRRHRTTPTDRTEETRRV